MRCSNCGVENSASAKFCINCAAPFRRKCTSCGIENPSEAKFCAECAAPLALLALEPKPSGLPITVHEPDRKEVVEGERKTVTALFADIKGSTELMEPLDPEEARAIVDPALRIMVEAVRRYEGYVVQSTGDGIFALFGAPAAYEDHPQRALHAALQMQQNLREYAQRLVNQGRPALEARFGINTGEVVVRAVETGGKIEYAPIGHTANLASRLQTLAPVGSIVVSELTRRLIEGYFEMHALGQRRVRGIGEPIYIYEVIGPGSLRTHFEVSARRGLTKFVGRERELQQLKQALELVMSGHGQLVAVVAEAGGGKSRFYHEFKATLPPGYKVLEAYSASHGKASAWLPVLELLRGYFGIQDGDDPASRREKIRVRIGALDAAISDILPYLWGLLGIQESPDPLAQMDPPIRRQRTLDAVKRIIVSESLNQPTVVIFEDLHWIDSETQALLDLLADIIAGARLLLLVNYRPEYRHEWSGRAHYLQLRLDPLGSHDAAAMLEGLLGSGSDLDSLKRLIAERTGGNPFFIEEMVQALFEEGVLTRNGAIKVARSFSQLRLPPTVQGMLAARIDRLETPQKELLQTLAVVGRESSLALIRQLASREDIQLERMLADLQAGEFIYEQPANGDIAYIFKHTLTQEVAYNSLLVERRKLLHELVATAIEKLFAGSIDSHFVELAYHYSRSENTNKAIKYLHSAGRQLAQRSAFSEALSYLNKGVSLLTALREHAGSVAAEELKLRIATAQCLRFARGWAASEVESTLLRARQLCAEGGTTRELFSVLAGLRQLYFMRLDFASARRFAGELIDLGERKQDAAVIAWGHVNLAQSTYLMGDLNRAHEQCEQAIIVQVSLNATHDLSEPKTYALSFMALILLALGYPDKAVRLSDEALSLAGRLPRPFSLATALFLGSLFYHLLRMDHRSLLLSERSVAIAAEHGLSSELAISTFYRGQALAGLGSVDEGISEMRRGIELYNSAGARTPNFMAIPLAEAHLKSGQHREGLKLLADAQDAVRTTGECLYVPELYRIRGHLLLLSDCRDESEAERCFWSALRSAHEQNTKCWELRAAASLARLLMKQNRRDEARAMLAEIYGWFTEGFDTADLKDAKALLDALAN